MGSYAPLLERTRVPQPPLQRLAVVAVFEKYRSEPQCDAGADAISGCLRSPFPAVVDQSVREVCRLVKYSKIDVSTALLELQSALDDSSNKRFASLFVKAIGLVTRLDFEEKPSSFRLYRSENHPFVKVLCCGAEAQRELVKQVIIFIRNCSHLGIETVIDFLRPFLNFSIIKVPSSISNMAFFPNLVDVLAAFCCSFPLQAIAILKLLAGCFKYFPCKNAEDIMHICTIIERLVDSYLVVLQKLVEMRLPVGEAQLCGLLLLQEILSLYRDINNCLGATEKILFVSRHLIVRQKDIGLTYVTELSSVMVFMFYILSRSELEHEQYAILTLIGLLLQWKNQSENLKSSTNDLSEELLFIFPVLGLVSSPSRCIKQSAADLLLILGEFATNLHCVQVKDIEPEQKQFLITSPGHIVHRLLRNLWFQQDRLPSHGLFYINCCLDDVHRSEDAHELKMWSSSLREYYSSMGRTGVASTSISRSEDISLTVCSVASVLLMHHTQRSTIDLMIICNKISPRIGVSMLLTVLFYNYVFSADDKSKGPCDLCIELLGMLPSVASHPAMIPLLRQIFVSMLHKDSNVVIKDAAIRLLCKAWEVNGQLYGTLQARFLFYFLFRCISVAVAASIRDVCKKDPDRGVDLILSVAACIENEEPLVQSLALQGLAHLCEADVIDFYTAWDVISKHVQNYLEDASVAHCLCLLLRWGAMDAEAYPDAASSVLSMLWEMGTHIEVMQNSSWIRVQEEAFTTLSQYEVVHIKRSISDFSTRNFEFLTSGPHAANLLVALEEFETRIIAYEHSTRQRYMRDNASSGSRSKISKLLGAVPEVIFRSGMIFPFKEVPGAALLCPPSRKDVNENGNPSKVILDISRDYEDSAAEISSSLQLSRNIILALFSLQSWKPFMQRWLRSCTINPEEKAHHLASDRSRKDENDILKSLMRLAEEAIPRAAENIVLAIGAFCQVLPGSAHAVASSAAKFLLSWLYQYVHEYRQWPAAISLGLISSGLHVTDHELKLSIINSLIEVASNSKSGLVKGACGIGLGLSCQGLLTTFGSSTDTLSNKDMRRMLETQVLRKIIWTLVQMICQFGGNSSTIIEKLAVLFPKGAAGESSYETSIQSEDIDNLEDGAWNVAGLIIGLGYSLEAIYRAGASDVVLYFKDLIISWVPPTHILSSNSIFKDPFSAMSALGACLALPAVVCFCHSVEMFDDAAFNSLMNGFMDLISGLLSAKGSGSCYQSLLVASCAGAGSILSLSLNARISLETEQLKSLLILFKRTYSTSHSHTRLGGMLGAINVMGAGAVTSIHRFHLGAVSSIPAQQDLESYHDLVTELTLLIQEISLLAQSTDDCRIRYEASWAISFLHQYFVSTSNANESSAVTGVAEDSLVMKISLWLMEMSSKLDTDIDIGSLALCLRCLSLAPRLPSLDWRVLISRCMRYGGRVDKMAAPLKNGILQEECFRFLLSHSTKLDSLLTFLDELCELARFKSLDSNLQSLMLLHFSDFLTTFSDARLVKLFDDMAFFFHSMSASAENNWEEKHYLRFSCWKGLQNCVGGNEAETKAYAYNVKQCVEVLFNMLPWPPHEKSSKIEWIEAMKCLGKAHLAWLLDLLQVSNLNNLEEQNGETSTHLKKIHAKIALVRAGTIPVLELTKLKPHILNVRCKVIWSILVEFSMALLRQDESVRRQWLRYTAEISCVTSYPSTAIRFLGLLSGSSCKYMPLLTADESTVLTDLPLTLSCLMETGSSWAAVGESVTLSLWRSTDRINDWINGVDLPESESIHESERGVAGLLFRVMHQSCVSLKKYLPDDKLLKLANM
ncbi:hypothetical protein M569_13918, partial [Genlisea aurea]